MINRDDMLELTRRMTPARTCFDRIAGAYMDDMGEISDSFNKSLFSLSIILKEISSSSLRASNFATCKRLIVQGNHVFKVYTLQTATASKNADTIYYFICRHCYF